MKKITLLLIGFIFTITAVNAQLYKTTIGIRGGLYSGVTLKHFVANTSAVEILVATRWSGIQATALIEFHDELGGSENFLWYYGFGGHVGTYESKNTPKGHPDNINGSYTTLGIDGIIGIEYSFSEVPINISLDYKPAINILGSQYFASDAAAFSIRYMFK